MKAIGPDSWKRLRQLLDRALEVDGDARRAFVDSLQGEDAALREELVRVLAQHDKLGQQSMANAMEMAVPAIADSIKDDAVLDQTRVGQTIGPYRLVRLLGAGGMGAVYLAERTSQDFAQQVALKLVRKAFATATTEERFERERRILAALKHPGIALLFDGGRTEEGQAFYTMEYVDGEAVTDFCRHLAITARVHLLLQVASALAYAHLNLVVHRDIKPSNVLVAADGQAKLVDFGLAKLLDHRADAAMTQGGIGPMTPAYAAPEQFHHEAVTVATDIYQFGVLCFVILTGRLPYRPDPNDNLAWARAVSEEEPMTLAHAAEFLDTLDGATPSAQQRKRLTRDLDAIVRKALAKDPEARYRSMDAMIADFESYLDNRPVNARRAGPLYFAWRFTQRWRYAVAATALAFVALAATAFFAVRQAHTAAREADRANSVADFLISLFKVSDPGENRGEKLTANQILDRGAERIDKDLASQPEQRARLLTTIGTVYSTMGDLPRAEPLLQRAAELLQATPDRDDYDLAHAWVRLAWVRNNQHRGRDAIDVLQRAIPLLHGDSPREITDLVAAHTFSALAHQDLAEPDAAQHEYESAISAIERAGGATTLTAGVYINYANFLRDRGDLAGARTNLEKALTFYSREFGENHYQTLFAKGNLVLTMIDEGDYDAARPLMERTAEQLRHVFGDNTSQYGRAQRVLGVIAWKQQRFDEADTYFKQAETSYAAALGANASDVSAPIENAGEMELDRGHIDVALSKFDRALALRKGALPADHPDVAEALDDRSQALIRLGRYDEAVHDADAALAIRRAKLAPDSAATVQTLYHLGLAHYAQGDTKTAKELWDDALARAPRAYRPNNPELAKLKAAIANPLPPSRDG